MKEEDVYFIKYFLDFYIYQSGDTPRNISMPYARRHVSNPITDIIHSFRVF
jgi:hypothetical protein